MIVIVDGQEAVVKENTVIDYVAENPDFKDVEDYTFNISFPLKGCNINKRIFGFDGRPDESFYMRYFEATIQAGSFIKQGCLCVMEVSDKELKAQFLAGRSAWNYQCKVQDLYIDELDLGSWETKDNNGIDMSDITETEAVALPWVNNSDGSINNIPGIREGSGGMSGTHPSSTHSKWCYMPYMLFIAKKIADEIGLTTVFDEWETSEKKWLLCCNTLPYEWNIKQYAKALPHWTVQEFFLQLGYILGGSFDFDMVKRWVSFSFNHEKEIVRIDKLVNSFSVEMSSESVEYIGSDELKFEDRGDEEWKFLSCDWLVHGRRASIIYYDSVDRLREDLKSACEEFIIPLEDDGLTRLPDMVNLLYYALDVKTLFVVRIRKITRHVDDNYSKVKATLCPINCFGSYNYSNKDGKKRDVKILPVRIDDAVEYGKVIFLDPGQAKDMNEITEDVDLRYVPFTSLIIRRGQNSDASSYYKNIFVGYWQGRTFSMERYHAPRYDSIEVDNGWDIVRSSADLRLNGAGRKYGYDIDAKCKFVFTFIAEEMYDPKAIFYIDGHKYVCAKINGTINDYGFTKKFKGEFYRII